VSFVVAIGANIQSAPIELLEKMSLDGALLEKYLHDLVQRDNVSEAVILSTCNRTDVFIVTDRFHGAFRDVRDFLSDVTFLPPEEFADSLHLTHEHEAIRYLFSLAAGLESAVIGEHEILGQVRDSWERAMGAGTTGSTLNLAFRHALEAGKRARSETAISRGSTSVSQASIVLAGEALGSLRDRSVAVVGAGSMARGVIDFGHQAGASPLTVVNRTPEKAHALAGTTHTAVGLSELATVLSEVDCLVAATSAPNVLIDVEAIETAMQARCGRELLIVDVGMPRNVEPAAGSIPGVRLIDMDGLGSFAKAGLESRSSEVPAVEAILDEELLRYDAASTAREVAPLIIELRARAELIVSEELSRHGSKLNRLDEDHRAVVEEIIRGVVAKLMHQPTTQLKTAAGTSRESQLATSTRELFDL
jgi:glutamyl-tRNA reductase